MKKEGVIILLAVFLFSALSITVSGACYQHPSTCFSGTVQPNAQYALTPGKVCSFESDTFACREKKEKFSYCCETRSQAGVVENAFLVAPQDVNAARNRMATFDYKWGSCFLGTLTDNGHCEPGNPVFVDMQQKEGITGYSNQKLYCDVGSVVCSIGVSGASFTGRENEYLNQYFACCPVQEEINVEATRKEIPFLTLKIDRGGFKREVNWCDDDYALCGLSFKEEELAADRFFKETTVSGLTCCKLTNAKVKKQNSFKPPANLNCFPNEIMCGAEQVRKQIYIGERYIGEHDYYSAPICCELEKCSDRPSCNNPEGDANCNGKKDKEEEICNQEWDDDGDDVKNKEDKCEKSNQCTIGSSQLCNPALSRCAIGLVCDYDTKTCIQNPNPRQQSTCIREEVIKDESSEFRGCTPSQVAVQGSEDAACAQLGFQTIVVEGKTMCCGDDGAEFFAGDKKACIDQQVVQSPDIGGGKGSDAVIYKKEGPIEVTEEKKTIDGDPVGDTNKLIPLRSRNKLLFADNNRHADNEYVMEFDATIDGREDPATKLRMGIYDNRGVQELLAEYPSFGEFRVWHNQRHLRAPVFAHDGPTEVKIVVRKIGTGDVRISNLVIYHKLTKKILFNENKFVMCTSPDKEENGAAESLRVTHPASAPLVTDKRNACQQEAGFYCDSDGMWKNIQEDMNELVLKEVPSERQQRELELDWELFMREPNSYKKRASACCTPDQCWNGERCVETNLNPSFASADGQKGLLCSKGFWEISTLKIDQFNTGSQLCPDTMCAYKTNDGTTCKPNGFYGPANEGEESEDIFCDAGEWTSRPVKIAQFLTKLPDTKFADRVGFPYSIYCDTPEEALVDKGFSPYLQGDATHFFEGDGANYVCVLQINTHALLDILYKGLLSGIPLSKNQVIVALALKEPDAVIKAPNEGEFVLSNLDTAYGSQQTVNGETLFTQCLGVFEYHKAFKQEVEKRGEEFHSCIGGWDTERARTGQGFVELKPYGDPTSESKLWYSRHLNTLLYSPKQFRVKS